MRKTESTFGDYYEGLKEELIAAGICKPEWFPTKPVPVTRRPGNIKRSFEITDGGREYILRDHSTRDGKKAGQWSVAVYCTAEEQERREAKREADKRAAENKRTEDAEAAFGEELKSALSTLPAFTPGSMSESEKYLMRIARCLTDKRWEALVSMAERLLVIEQVHEPEAVRPERVLRLVVDNEARQ